MNRRLDAQADNERATGDVGALPDGKALRVLSLGFDRLVADLFWIRTVYYVGDEVSEKAGYPAVERLANLVTDIDPGFRTVYVVMSGAIGALKQDPDGAIRLLKKGVQHVDYWKLHFLLGFNYFVEKLDYKAAAREMQLAAEKDGPPYLPLLASRLYADAGDPQTAFAFIQARLREEPEGATREALEERYKNLWISRDLATIDEAIEVYRASQEAEPATVSDLVRAGLLEREPRDPAGGRYGIDEGVATTRLPYEPLEVHVPHAPIQPSAATGPDAGR